MIEIFSMVSAMTSSLRCRLIRNFRRFGLNASARLRNTGDLCSGLRRTLWEELVEFFDRDARSLAEYSNRWSGTFFGELCAHELNDLPVLFSELIDARRLGNLRCHLLVPLIGILEEPLFVN